MPRTALADRHAVVVGGAVAGATTALLLAGAGAQVTLLERVAEPKAVGAGILLQPNGLGVLYGLGLRERLAAGAARATTIGVADGGGRVLASTRVPDFGDGLDHVLVLRRSHLSAVLLDAVAAHPGIVCRFGAHAVTAAADGTVEYEAAGERSRVVADLVVGADGVRSTVRACGAFGERLTEGPWYLRGLAPPLDVGALCEHWTALGIVGAGDVGDGTYFYASTAAPAVRTALARRDLAGLRDAWAAALPLAGRAFGAVARVEDLLVNQVIRVDCARWVDGRLVVLGDAAHAMAPNLGQGANSALVDAAVLVWELAAGPDPATALARWDARRRPAVRRVQDGADRLARLGELRHPALRRVRDVVARAAAALVDQDRATRAVQQEEPAWLQAAVRGRC